MNSEDVLKTVLGTDIPLTCRGILYVCEYSREACSLKVTFELLFDSAFEAMMMYSDIPNPESQVATGKDYDGLIADLCKLHTNMVDPKWLKALGDCI